MIKEFFIRGLYEDRNVTIPIDSSYKIIVAENGYGKTTILNCFYALVSGDISKLRKIDFQTTGLRFDQGEEISFEKVEFEADLERVKGHPFYEHLESRLGEDYILRLIDDVRRYSPSKMELSNLFRNAMSKLDLPSRMLRDYLREVSFDKNSKHIASATSKKILEIQKQFPFATLHLPTYRRVEEDIGAFSSVSDSESYPTRSINFGMGDVSESIKEITSEILSSSVEWFSKINGQMLSQLVGGFQVTNDMKASLSKPKAVEIVLERIGKNIADTNKEEILSLVSSGEILTNHDPLIYFVANLLKVYEQQQENDEAIQSFTSVCNRYLRDKEIVYDESNVTIEVVRKKNLHKVSLDSLSSGEKQIVSLFAMLYLQKKEELAIFFDEPELSLSIEWQKTLLPDIVNSGKCKFLFATTHSPFIFENELQSNTVDLSKYVEEV